MWHALLTGVSLGLFAAVQPGVFQAFLLGETMRWGFLATLPLVIAPLVSDGPVAMITLLVLSRTPPWLIASIELLGGLFVIWLALDAARSLRAARKARSNPGATEVPIAADQAAMGHHPATFRRRFVKAVLVNGLNPGPWLFWALVLGPITVDAWRSGPWVAAVAVGSFYVTLIGGFLGLVVLFGLASRRGARLRAALQGVSAVALLGFGILLIWHGGSSIV